MIRLGLDIGSTKLVAAVYRNSTASIVRTSAQERSIKFCLAFDDDERTFDKAAEHQYFENPENTIFGRDVMQLLVKHKEDISMFSTGIQTSAHGFSVQYKHKKYNISIEQAIAMMVNHLKLEIGSSIQRTNIPCVVTVPSIFDSTQRFAIKNAVASTGMDVIGVLNSTAAAAITYVYEKQLDQPKNICIINMGALFLDVGIFEVSNDMVNCKSTLCNINLGGDRFTWQLFYHYVEEIKNNADVYVIPDNKLTARLYVACEKLKIKLSSARKGAKEELGLIGENLKYSLEMTKEQFEAVCSDLLNKVASTVKEILTDFQINTIDEVVAVGNGIRIPIIKERLNQLFEDKEIKMPFDNSEAIAIGAAYYDNGKSNVTVHNVLTQRVVGSLGNTLIEIERNNKLPQEKKFSCPSEVSFMLCQGQRELVKSQLSYKFDSIEVKLDQNGLIKILGSSRHSRWSTINRAKTLIDHHIYDKKVIQEIQSQEKNVFGINDYARKNNLRNELESSCNTIKKLLKKNGNTDLLKYCEYILSLIEGQTNVDIQVLEEEYELMNSIQKNMKEFNKLIDVVAQKNTSKILAQRPRASSFTLPRSSNNLIRKFNQIF